MEDNKPKYEVFVVNTAQYYTLHTKKFGMRKKWQAINPNEVLSIIPGTVLDIFVQTGQKVEEGQPLLKYEAMKMETTVDMPFAGIIKEILVAIGDRIKKDQVMILIEEE